MRPRMRAAAGGQAAAMFFFFSNRLGCFGSIMISLLITGVLLLIFDVV